MTERTDERVHDPEPGEPEGTPGSSAALDSAHVGDIHGAFGTIRLDDVGERRSFKRRLSALATIIGPGIIVMVGDNDAGGVGTYSQAGQNYGTRLLWVLLLLIPVLIVNQEMVVRLGCVTGVGHARLINERFGRGWGWFSAGDLFLLNFLTLATEFIGISLAASYIGLSKYLVVPLAAVLLIAVAATGSFRRWERSLFVFITFSLVLVPLVFLSQPRWGTVAHDFVVPGLDGGFTSDAVLLIIAMVGTTVAPWQLFFQQSNIIDKRITPRFINYERLDTVVGSLIVVGGAMAVMIIADYAARSTGTSGQFVDAGGIARLLSRSGRGMGALFAVLLLDASIIGAAAVTLATSYAFGDMFGVRHSLHRRFKDAKQFYLSYALMIVGAAAIVLIPGAPLGLITTSVQALAGLLLPSATVFLLLLCNDPQVLGPWVNGKALNALAAFIVTTLLVLSGTLMATTLFPDVDVTRVATGIAIGAAVVGAVAAIAVRHAGRGVPRQAHQSMTRAEKSAWRMPQLTLLKPVTWSPGLKLGILAMRGYLVISAILLAVKFSRL